MDKNHNEVNTFWGNFSEKVIENGVSAKYADWYVKWAENPEVGKIG